MPSREKFMVTMEELEQVRQYCQGHRQHTQHAFDQTIIKLRLEAIAMPEETLWSQELRRQVRTAYLYGFPKAVGQ